MKRFYHMHIKRVKLKDYDMWVYGMFRTRKSSRPIALAHTIQQLSQMYAKRMGYI